MTTSMPWFRVYSEILDDRKIKRICKRTGHNKAMVIGTWVCLLALASDSPKRGQLSMSEGMPYTIEEVADEIGVDTETAETLLNEFVIMGMIAMGETMAICNWEKRQYKSDNSTERVKKFRDKNDETLLKRYSNVLDTDTDTESDTEKELIELTTTTGDTKTAVVVVENAFKVYHETFGIMPSKTLGDKIQEAITTYSEKWVCAAIKTSGLGGGRSWNHVEAILKNWQVYGFEQKPPGNGRYTQPSNLDQYPVFHREDEL